ncbi:MAG: hypothetical protein IPI30_04420 [Saprospiraceae bacterium]|nr:hypothetical protein [Candidatus Vicinibacter affinis]
MNRSSESNEFDIYLEDPGMIFLRTLWVEDRSDILFINTSMKGGDIDNIKGGKDIFMW